MRVLLTSWSRSGVHALLLVLLVAAPTPLSAEEVCFYSIAPGVDWCADSLSPVDSSQSIDVHWAIVDLTEPTLYLRVTREDEGSRTTSDMASLLGSSVTINGDWADTVESRPLGLSVGGGVHWTGTRDWDSSTSPPGDWSFLACTAAKQCRMNAESTLEEWVWNEINVVGGNGARLVVDGVLRVPAYDLDVRPRSAVCLDATGTVMTFFAAEGEGPGEGVGIHTWEMAEFVSQRGCYNGLMLDGGGSTDLVLLGTRVGERPVGEPQERSHYNHLSIVHADSLDPACSFVMNGRYCDGTELHTCQGGLDDPVDCSVFGLSCEEDLGTAYCVSPQCNNGGNGDVCLDASTMARCDHGMVFETSCADLFGSYCEDTGTSARCVPATCVHGGDVEWCDGDVLKVCAPALIDGLGISTYAEEDCGAVGQTCSVLASSCVDLPGDDDDSGDDESGDDES